MLGSWHFNATGISSDGHEEDTHGNHVRSIRRLKRDGVAAPTGSTDGNDTKARRTQRRAIKRFDFARLCVLRSFCVVVFNSNVSNIPAAAIRRLRRNAR